MSLSSIQGERHVDADANTDTDMDIDTDIGACVRECA